MEGNSVHQSFTVLKEHFDHQQSTANPAQLVIFAESAFRNGHGSLASECLELYFSLEPPSNQFLVRAHLCQALISAASNPAAEANMQRALESIVKAVNIAKKSECYHFLVHNASVLLWQICRPFRKPGLCRLCVSGWQSVARAQEQCKEEDPGWRLDILLALLQSQIDAGQKEEAGKTCHSAVQLARKKVPGKLIEVLKLQVYSGLGEGKGMEKEMKSIPEFPITVRLYKLKHAISKHSKRQPELEQELRALLETILTTKPRTEKKTPSSKTPPPALSAESKSALLLELAQLCLEQGLPQLCRECMEALPRDLSQPRLVLLRVTVTSQLTLQGQGEKAGASPYSKRAVEAREQAIQQLEESLTAAQRLSDQELTQHISVVLWGVCLPLLQPNLRHRLSRSLSVLASALEQADSLLHELRCLVHLELAKVCADQSQLQTALEHINKAKELDHTEEHSEQLKWLGHRLWLRSQLYHTPSSSLDQAAQIVEQVSSTSDCGTGIELRALLVRAGELMAPGFFKSALGDVKKESEKEAEGEGEKVGEVARGKDVAKSKSEDGDRRTSEVALKGAGEPVGSLTSLESDSAYGEVGEGEDVRGDGVEGTQGRETLYRLAKEQALAHKESVGTDDEADRCRLWADLAKLARKREVWDVACVASKFCLIYDDQRWSVQQLQVDTQASKAGSKSKLHKTSSLSVNRSQQDTHHATPSPLPQTATGKNEGRKKGKERECRNLVRTLAETHCIHGECLVYQLREEGCELGEKVSPSTAGNKEADAGTSTSSAWPAQLSSDAYQSFLRAAELGCSLQEAWLVSNAATYLWNYSHHFLQEGRLRELIPVFRPLLSSVKHDKMEALDAGLVCQLCTALAGGLVQRWMPSPPDPTSVAAPSGGRKSAMKGRLTSSKKKPGGDAQLQVSPEAGPELKEALEVCEAGLAVQVGVPVALRASLLGVWVQCKQLLQQPIPSKTFGVEQRAGDSEAPHCRAAVAVEMLSRMGNRIWDFPDCPSLNDAFQLMCACQWTDLLLELELLTRIARLALTQKNYDLVSQCTGQALQNRRPAHKKEGAAKKEHNSITQRQEKELLSVASSLQGQGLLAGGAGNMAFTRRALEAFLESAKYGRDAGSYPRALEASQHYWNTCQGLVQSPMDREPLQQPLKELLAILTSFLPKRGQPADKETVKMEDLKLLGAVYNVVFQVYADKDQWEEGLKAIEDAVWVTPRSIHRDLAQHKLVFRSKMGKSVDGDMVRFQEEPEELRASLWFKAATNSTSPLEQLKAYQNAIGALTCPVHLWQKVDYIMEFSEWLYQHQFPVEDALGQLQWALTLLLTLGGEGRGEEEGDDSEGRMASNSVKESGKKSGLGDIAEDSSPLIPQPQQPQPAQQLASFPDLPPPARASMSSARVLDTAMRTYVMMSQLHSRGSEGHIEYCLAALGCCCLLWKNCLESCSQSSSGGAVHVPTSLQEWGDFLPTDEMKDYVKSTECEKSMNRKTVSKPALTCHYLDVLNKELCECSLHPLALPAESLRLLVLECLVGSRAAVQLAHMRLASLCAAVGAHSAAAQHSKMAGSVCPIPEDVARSRAEVQEYQAKRELVAKEEAKGTGSERHVKLKSPTHPTPLTCRPVQEGVVLREVWAEQADLLVTQGQYQVARELLHETETSAQVLEDSPTLAKVLLTQASLAVAEKKIAKCITLVSEAQRYPMTLDTWLQGMLILIEAASRSRTHRKLCLSEVSAALGSLGTLELRNRNDKPRVVCVQAALQARLTAIRAQVFLDNGKKEISELDQLSEDFSEHTATLLQIGRNKTAAKAMLDHGSLMRTFASSLQDTRHRVYLLKAVKQLQEAVSTLHSVQEKVQSLCPLSDDLCLPVQTLLVEAQLQLAETLLQVFEEYGLEVRERRNEQQQKSCIEKMIDDFVREVPNLTSLDEEWNSTASVAVDKALAVLTSSHSAIKSKEHLKARCTFSTGQALLLMSKHTSPDPPRQWERGVPQAQEVSSSGTENESKAEEGEERGGGGGGDKLTSNKHSTLSLVMRKDEASEAEVEEASSLQYLAQACQFLGQAVNLALSCGDKEVAQRAALSLVDACGTHDPATAALYLALYQSCVVSRHLHKLLCQVQPDPSTSKLAALLQQYSELSTSSPPVLAATIAELKTYECWRRLEVSPDHLDFLRSFPSHFRFIVLQHSEDKSQLYAAYLIPPQPPPPAQKKGQPPPGIDPLEPVVSRASVFIEDFESLLELVSTYKKLQVQQLTKPKINLSKDGMSVDFKDITTAMDAYLSHAVEPILTALKRESSEIGLSLILLADFDLLKLPLEASSFLQFDTVHSVVRDFSLQMLQHRISKYMTEEEESDPSRKKEKFQQQPSFLQANTANFKYILDPRHELDSGSEQPCDKILAQIQAFSKVTSKWNGHNGNKDAISLSQWAPLLKQCSGILFFGAERMMAHFPPSQLVSLSMQECSVAIVVDHMQTPNSSLTQSKLDIQKSEQDLRTEQPLQAAAVLSLVGVGCLIGCQWYTTVQISSDNMCKYISALLSEAVSVGNMHWKASKERQKESSLMKTNEHDPLHPEDGEIVEREDLPAVYNSVVYGLPHLALVLPTE